MSKEIVLYKDNKVWFHNRTYTMKYAFRAIHFDTCPLCLKKMCDGDEAYLIISNYILFPNMFVHKTCVKSKEDCIKQMISGYNEAKRVTKKYSFWFN